MTQKKGSSHARSFFLLGQENVYIYIYAAICNNKHKYLYLLPHHCVTIFLPPSPTLSPRCYHQDGATPMY